MELLPLACPWCNSIDRAKRLTVPSDMEGIRVECFDPWHDTPSPVANNLGLPYGISDATLSGHLSEVSVLTLEQAKEMLDKFDKAFPFTFPRLVKSLEEVGITITKLGPHEKVGAYVAVRCPICRVTEIIFNPRVLPPNKEKGDMWFAQWECAKHIFRGMDTRFSAVSLKQGWEDWEGGEQWPTTR